MAQNRPTHENRIQRIEYWRDGNGAPGAEERLRRLEGGEFVTEGRMQEVIENTVHEVLRSEHGENRADWKKWIDTLGWITAVAMLTYSIFGG